MMKKLMKKLMKKIIFYLLLFCLQISLLTETHAETITSQRISSTLRFVPLKKMTIGPDDQYHGTVDPSGQILAFTRKSDLVSHICQQKLSSGEVTDLLPLTADSQEPAFNSEGEMTFTYYKFRAAGDICYKSLKNSKNPDDALTCLKADDGESSTPFWKSSKELGYLLKDPWSKKSKIVIANLESGTQQTLAEGQIWSPSMKPGGRFLFYNEMIQKSGSLQRVLILKDLQTQKTKIVQFALPGISGFPAVSDDEKYLFFSHYLNDTNNDNLIDGNDNSVIFRAPIAAILGEDKIFPEQLTSVESNCSFPKPFKEVIYATCAFEGALDIYEIPTTGIVPSQWTEATLKNAHQTRRSYAERILVLNTLKYRFPQRSNTSLEERILSNHIMADDLASSKYYLQHIRTLIEPEKVPFFSILNQYLEAREKKKIQKSEEVTPSLEKEVLRTVREIDLIQGYPRFKKIIKGLLFSFLNQTQRSASYLKEIQFDSRTLPLERYFYFELARWTLPRIQPKQDLNQVYRQMMIAPELSEESQIYYTFQFLSDLQASHKSIQFRISKINQEIKSKNGILSSPISTLLQSEASTLKLVSALSENEKSAAYRELDQLMSSSRNDYFLRKALYIRSILNLTDAGEFNFMSLIATNWLRYTQLQDTEFATAREVVSISNLDQAYDALGKNNSSLAANYFYGSLTLTDDLESHFGYIQSKVSNNQRDLLNSRYQNLKDHQQIEDHLKFVEALLILIDARPESPQSVDELNRALEKLLTMKEDRDSPVRYLLMGYCSLEKLFRLSSGFEFEQELFENAHRNLMLALDQGWDNTRIQASALMNLGLLHQRVQNHGLAVKFFTRRKALGFTTEEESAQFAWFYGRSLFFNHQADPASEEVRQALSSKNLPARYKIPLQERQGFYLTSAGKFSEAAQIYNQVLQKPQPDLLNPTNLAKIYLNYGYTLFKLKQENEAKKALRQSLKYSEQLKSIPRGGQRSIDFHPVRLKLIAYGLLSQMGPASERLIALEKRNTSLKESKDLLEGGLSTLIQNELQIAAIIQSSDPKKAAQHLNEALKGAEQVGDLNESLSVAVHRATVNFLAHSILHPQFFEAKSSERIRKVVEKSLQSYAQQELNQPLLTYQKLKIQMLWAAFSVQVLKSGDPQELLKISGSESMKRLKQTLPTPWAELTFLASQLGSTLTPPPQRTL